MEPLIEETPPPADSQPPRTDAIYVHHGNGRRYVIASLCVLKTRPWKNKTGVIYREEGAFDLYCRPLVDFREAFRLTE